MRRIALVLIIMLLANSAFAGLGKIDSDDFLAIKPGDSYAEVSKRFGHDFRHSFTVCRQGHEWRLFKCYLNARRYDGLARDLLFKDDVFEKFVDVPRTVRSGDDPLSWQPGDCVAVDRVLASRFDLDRFKGDQDCYDGKSDGSPSLGLLPLIVFAPLVALEWPWRYKAARAHEKAQMKLDGSNFRIGEDAESICVRLGDPLTKRMFAESGREVWSYAYTSDEGRLTVSQTCSRLVLIVRAGKVESIYNTDSCGSSDWLVPPSWFK